MVDYKIRGVHVVMDRDTELHFQVLTYGLPDVDPGALEMRMEKRGIRVGVYDMKSRYCEDTYKDDQPRRYPQSAEDRYRQHFFSPRI